MSLAQSQYRCLNKLFRRLESVEYRVPDVQIGDFFPLFFLQYCTADYVADSVMVILDTLCWNKDR